MILNYKKTITTALISFSIVACNPKTNETIDDNGADDVTETTTKLDSQKISAQNVFNALPKRDLVLDIIKTSNAEYDASVLNNPDNLKTYTTENSEALNLGVYGADLNVTTIYEQTQESILFLNCVNLLSKKLGVSSAFDEKMMSRMDAHRDNRDSTMSIVSQSFKKCDEYLTSNNRIGASSLIVAGSWIEGMYIACNTAKATNSKDAVKTIFEQKESLKYLIELLQAAKAGNKIDYLIPDLKAIEVICNAKTDNAYSVSSLKELQAAVNTLREKIISSN